MRKTLVTGATGCVGSNLIAALIKAGYQVCAFRREHSNLFTLHDIDVEHIVGDIRDKGALRKAIRGCDTVFHVAGVVGFWKKKRKEQYEVNALGTRNVVEACLELGVQKLIHTSTVAALGYRIPTSREQLVDESIEYNWGSEIGYRYTKHLAEQEILRGVGQGLNATIVNPSVIIGPRDIHFHGGSIIRSVKRGTAIVYIDGGLNLVNVHDVVAGHIAAAEWGRSGERYILGGINLTHRQAFELAARVVGGHRPKLKVPFRFATLLGTMFDLIGEITNWQPWITSDLLAGANRYQWYSIEKAKRELGYEPTSVEDAMKEAYEWYRENGMMVYDS